MKEKKIYQMSIEPIRKHKIYKLWSGVKNRCYSQTSQNFKYYGGRGIEMDSAWRFSYECFFEWCIKNGWAAGLQLDRIDVDGNYCPDNCRFVTAKENLNNRRNTSYVKYNGKLVLFRQICSELGLERETIRARMNRGGLSFEEAAFNWKATKNPNFYKAKGDAIIVAKNFISQRRSLIKGEKISMEGLIYHLPTPNQKRVHTLPPSNYLQHREDGDIFCNQLSYEVYPIKPTQLFNGNPYCRPCVFGTF